MMDNYGVSRREEGGERRENSFSVEKIEMENCPPPARREERGARSEE